ncbi:hypothetical protein HII36_34400 [Nonomuraea sp. NN258]|uniref:hypothetical protein n=1 Tax=Nonomuraea antri TaxID=2730852 RepID=UPI001569BC77|nr:hypothetical protein [Nonomuraea antri]NRQ36893.1 hypothetical protein [Nonomuraea antri]
MIMFDGVRRIAAGLALVTIVTVVSGCGSPGVSADQAATKTGTETGAAGEKSATPKAQATKKTASPGTISKGALIRKMLKDPDNGDVPRSYITCMADLVLKYGDRKDVQRYLQGEIKSEKIKGISPSNKPFWNEADKCIS